MDLPGRLALGLTANCKFKSEEALEIFVLLPRSQSRTAWVQCQVAKANFELVRYEAAATHFKEARRLDRFRLEDLEIYSTVLWHMKRETELMYLAHELMAVDRLSPQSWCVLGNCFSLQKEHDTALQCLPQGPPARPEVHVRPHPLRPRVLCKRGLCELPALLQECN